MHTYPTHNKKGDLIGFEISNLLISRGRVVRLLRTIPTVTITKLPKRWVMDDDDFVHFTVNRHLFKVIEPFGDNSRYWIVAEDEAGQGEVEGIRKVFDAHNILGLGNKKRGRAVRHAP
jgi:hypothetical protein